MGAWSNLCRFFLRKGSQRGRPETRRLLRVERLEDRTLLTITISGTIGVADLECADGTVPVRGAHVIAQYRGETVDNV